MGDDHERTLCMYHGALQERLNNTRTRVDKLEKETNELEKRVNDLTIKHAKITGGIGAVLAVVQVLLKYLG
jgi:hypothetical protein